MQTSSTRRDFLKASALTAGALAIPGNAHAAGSDTLRVGLVGCGGRGTGAAGQALNADNNVKLVAMADAFEDRLQQSLATLKRDETIASKLDVKPERCFSGFDAYKNLLTSGVDVVLLCSPPHFRPEHLRAAIAAGKHVFAEKPVAVDAPGVRSVVQSCEEARRRGLSVVSGLCLRYGKGFGETVKRIHDGAVGDIAALHANDLRGPIWVKPRQPGWSDMEWQMRNWYYFTWLSGDFNVEQHVHFLDLCSWLMKDQYPIRANGMGGRQVRTGPEFGHIYDHHAVVYEYENGSKLFGLCRQQSGCKSDISAHVMGTKGNAFLSSREFSISSDSKWKYEGPKDNMFQTEHDVLFASIRSGKPVNNGDYMTKSTLLSIMGRMASYTGKTITWDMAWNSKEDLTPAKYEWGALATPEVAMPGKTPFV